jgi:hypothetical protein
MLALLLMDEVKRTLGRVASNHATTNGDPHAQLLAPFYDGTLPMTFFSRPVYSRVQLYSRSNLRGRKSAPAEKSAPVQPNIEYEY